MKTGKTDVLNIISTLKKPDLRTNSNGLQMPFRDRLSRQNEEMFHSASQNKKYEEKTKIFESQSNKKVSFLKKNLKMEAQKKYSTEIKSHENLDELKMKNFTPLDDKVSTLSTDNNVLPKGNDNDIEVEFGSDMLKEMEGEVLSDDVLLSAAIYSTPLLLSSEVNVKNDAKDLTVLNVEPLISEFVSENREPISTVATFNNKIQVEEDNIEEPSLWNEIEDLSHSFSFEKSVGKNESVKKFQLASEMSSLNTNLNVKQTFSMDKMKEEELSTNYNPQGVQEEDQVLKITDTKGNSFLSNDFSESSDRENKAETFIETEKTTTQLFHKNTVPIRERTFEEVIESKLEPHVDSGKIMLEDIRYQINQSKKQIKVQLKPKELGEMTLDLQVFKGGVIAKIFVDNEKAKFVIEQNLSQLRETFKNSGTEIKTVEVFVGNNSNFQMNQQSMAQSRGSGHSMNYNKNNNGYMEMSLTEEESGQEAVITEGFDVLA